MGKVVRIPRLVLVYSGTVSWISSLLAKSKHETGLMSAQPAKSEGDEASKVSNPD